MYKRQPTCRRIHPHVRPTKNTNVAPRVSKLAKANQRYALCNWCVDAFAKRVTFVYRTRRVARASGKDFALFKISQRRSVASMRSTKTAVPTVRPPAPIYSIQRTKIRSIVLLFANRDAHVKLDFIGQPMGRVLRRRNAALAQMKSIDLTDQLANPPAHRGTQRARRIVSKVVSVHRPLLFAEITVRIARVSL